MWPTNMLIDDLSIKFSNRAVNHTVSGPSQDRFINQWANTLEDAGWTQVGALHAEGELTYPLGAPISDGIDTLPKTIVGCSAAPGFFSIGPTQFSLYDPFHQLPGTTTACVFVPMGTTYAETFDNLAAAISGLTAWSPTVIHNGGASYTVHIDAVAAGPEFNELLLSSNGFASGQDVTHGGGYTMRSAGDSTSTVYDCTMTAADRGGAGNNYLAGLLKFDFTINGHHVSYQLLNDVQGTLGFMGALGVGAVPAYQIVANPYGFAVFDNPRDNNTRQFRAISIFCMAPYFPTDDVPDSEDFIPADAVCIIGPNNIGDFLSWDNQFMSPSTYALDDVPVTSGGLRPHPRALAYRSTTFALQSVYGIPIYMGAYVQFGSGDQDSDPAWVVGKLWDCAVLSDFVGGNGVVMDGKQFMMIGYGGGTDHNTITSFLMACGIPAQAGYPVVGQSSACMSAPGNPGSSSQGNTGH